MRSRATAAGRSHGREGDPARGSTAPVSLLSQWAVPLLPGVLTRPPGWWSPGRPAGLEGPSWLPSHTWPVDGVGSRAGLGGACHGDVTSVLSGQCQALPASSTVPRGLLRKCSQTRPGPATLPASSVTASAKPPGRLQSPTTGTKALWNFSQTEATASELGAPLRRESAAAPSDPKHRSPSAPTAPPSPQPAASARL